MVRLKQRYLLVNILYPPSNATSNNLDTDPIAFQAPTPAHVTASIFINHLKRHITLLFGDFGLGVSLSSLKVVYLSNATSTLILRVPRNHHRLVWAALTHIQTLPSRHKAASETPCVVRVVRVSGTIRKAEEELIRRAKRDVLRARLVQDGRQPPAGASFDADDDAVELTADLSGGDNDDDDEDSG